MRLEFNLSTLPYNDVAQGSYSLARCSFPVCDSTFCCDVIMCRDPMKRVVSLNIKLVVSSFRKCLNGKVSQLSF